MRITLPRLCIKSLLNRQDRYQTTVRFVFLVSFLFVFLFCFFFYKNQPHPPTPTNKKIVIYISTQIWFTMKFFTIFSQKGSKSLRDRINSSIKNNHGLAKSRFCQFWYVYLLPKAMQRKTNWNAFSVISLHLSGSEGINDIPA